MSVHPRGVCLQYNTTTVIASSPFVYFLYITQEHTAKCFLMLTTMCSLEHNSLSHYIASRSDIVPCNKIDKTLRGELYSKFSFGEVYRRIYGRKFSFTATREYGYPHSNALLQSRLKFERCKPHKAAQRRTSSNKM